MERPLVSIVVLNWNGKRFIDAFMSSFLNQTYPAEKLELVFTDNGSTDDSVSYFQNRYNAEGRYKVILNGRNYGYSGGNNFGMEHTSGDYILLCNNDLELDPHAVDELVRAAEIHNADATTVKLMYRDRPGVINNAGSRLDTESDWPIYDVGINEVDVGQFDDDQEISAFCGACVLLRRDFLQTVGLFDQHFFLYFEDGDLSWRGRKAGKRYWLAPKAVAFHVHTGSSEEGSPVFNHFVIRNRWLILVKNARARVIIKALGKTLKDQLILRLRRLVLAVIGKYPRRLALREFVLSQRMLWAALFMTPYALCKRFRIIKERHL
jgi:GT2 family glycosyltransferase